MSEFGKTVSPGNFHTALWTLLSEVKNIYCRFRWGGVDGHNRLACVQSKTQRGDIDQ